MQKKPKIVFIIPNYLPGELSGSEIIVRDLAESLVKLKFAPTIVTSDVLSGRSWYDPFYRSTISNKHESISGVTVVRLSCNTIRSAFLFILNRMIRNLISVERIEVLSWGPILRGLEKTLLAEQPDIVILSPFPAGICLTGHEICKHHNIPYAVIPFFKKDQKLFRNLLLRKILDDARAIYTPTKTERQYIKNYTRNDNIFLLPSSIDDGYIRSHMKEITAFSHKLRKRLVTGEGKIVLFVGNKGIEKGVVDASEAVKAIRKPHAVFVALGNNTREWNAYLSRQNGPNIVDVSYKSGIEKYAYYMASDVVVLPSVTDNFPLVFLEAWQFGKPVIAYDFYSMSELLSDGSGFLARPHDIKNLTNTIEMVLSDTVKSKKAGMIGLSKVKQYSRDNVVKEYFLEAMNRIL